MCGSNIGICFPTRLTTVKHCLDTYRPDDVQLYDSELLSVCHVPEPASWMIFFAIPGPAKSSAVDGVLRVVEELKCIGALF